MSNLMRIGSNVQALNALRQFEKTNNSIADLQFRLATGKRINSAQDDTAGYAIGNLLESRTIGLQQAYKNVGNAQNILNIAQGGYNAQMQILQDIKAKVGQASDDSIDSTQRAAIDRQVSALLEELDDIMYQTKWNGESVLDGSSNGTFAFQVGAEAEDTLNVVLDSSNSAAVGTDDVVLSTMDLTTSSSTAAAGMATVDNAIASLAESVQTVGNYLVRLKSKEEALSVSVTNTEAARSRIVDADFAEEQMSLMKYQILQQTGLSALSQANSAPQAVLALFQ